jgi:hypothetical protein
MENDVTLEPADLADNHRSGMERSADGRCDAKVSRELVGRRLEGSCDGEKTPYRAGILSSVACRPRDDYFIADILVDVAAMVIDGVGRESEDTVQELMNSDRPNPLGESG